MVDSSRTGRAIRPTVLLVAPLADNALRDDLHAAGFALSADAGTHTALNVLFEAQRPDLVVLDPRAAGDSVEAAGGLLRRYPAAKVVILAAEEDVETFLEAVRLGVVGYVVRPTDPDALGAALRDVLGGRASVPRRFLPRLIEELRLL